MIDDDVTTAATPPAEFYLDPARHAAERSLFARNWQLVARAGQLRESGDHVATSAGGEPLLLVNDHGTLRGFFNVCRHRAGPLASGCGRAARLVCRYHGWTYDLDGRLLRAPEMDGALNFDPTTLRLRPIAVHRFGPLLFAALDGAAASFEATHPGLTERCAALGLDSMRHVLTRDYPVNANWKIYVDNYLEGYHIPMVHPALDRELDYRAYVTELGERQVLQYAPPRAATAALYEATAWYYWLFPNVMLNIYEGQLQTNVVIPVAPDRTIVRFEWYSGAALSDEKFREMLAFTETVQAEDAQICETVQRNLGSAGFTRGRYSPVRERGVHLFHRLLQA